MSERRSLRRASVASRLVAVACAAGISLPQAVFADDCLRISLHGLRDFEASPVTPPPRTTFRLNEQFVLCVNLDANMFVTIWDAPPAGSDVERLFPNRMSHPGQSTLAAEILAGRHCYGTKFGSDPEFPLVQDEGPGKGKITVVASTSMADQPTLDDYKIPGRTLKAAATRLLIVGPTKTCDSKLIALVQYEVVR